MEVAFYKYAFIVIMGIAMLGTAFMAITVVVLALKVFWLWLRARVGTIRTRHA